MRLLVFSHKLFRQTANGLQTNGAFTVQMDALATHFSELILCVPVQTDAVFRGVSLTAPNIRVLPLPHLAGRGGFLRSLLHLRRAFVAAMPQADLGLVILPGYFGVFASWVCQRRRFPIFQWVVGDWRQNVQSRRAGWAGRLAQVWTPLLDWAVKWLTRDVLTFFNGRILYQPALPHHHTRVSSSIRLQDVYERPVTAVQPPYHLLFVGRLSAEKGITYLLKAISILRKSGHDVILHLVGAGQERPKLMQEVYALALAEQVIFHGFVPFGDNLRQLYRQSDLFILPALQDQQPKVLMEAMSQSLPVIATRTGGIPTVIQDGENGLLVAPGEPGELATAVTRILTNDQLYHHLVQNGLEFVRQRTVDAETEKMMQIISAHFDWSEN